MSSGDSPEILNIEEAAALLGVSIKTFNKVLHSQNMPARKIGREWKFSRRALIAWVGSGNSASFYRDGAAVPDDAQASDELRPTVALSSSSSKSRRTGGWRIEPD